MSAYLHKEIRLLLPSSSIAVGSALGVWLIPTDHSHISELHKLLLLLPLILCPGLVIMASLDSFGREISSSTFSNLLSQPVPRERIWWTKTLLLAAALLIVFSVWWLSFLLHLPTFLWSNSKETTETFHVTAMIVVAAYSGGLWSVLLLRQVGAAFWFTVIAPTSLASFTAYLTEKFGKESDTDRNVMIMLLIYGVAGFFWARRMFLHAQDVQWTGGNIALPGWVKLPRVFGGSIKLQGRRPRLALLAKEFQLHQSSLVIAIVLAVLHVGVVIIRKTHPNPDDTWGVFDFVIQVYWGLWFLMPLLIGCTAIAEERKLGTLESQLCLPSNRRGQFVFKFGVGLVLSVFFAVIVPLLFEGSRILPNFHDSIEKLENNGEFLSFGKLAQTIIETLKVCDPFLPYLPALLVAICFFCIAFYASSLTRNTLQSIAPGILGIIIAWAMLLGGRWIEEVYTHPLWRGWLIYIIGVPVLTVVLACLTWWNFKHVLVGWPVWRRNLLAFFLSLAGVMLVTTVLYQRTWELFVRLEPTHGPARLTQTGQISIRTDGMRALIHLPDGRVWSVLYELERPSAIAAILGNFEIKESGNGQFLPGTNWQAVAFTARDTMALKPDGSLWVSEKSATLKRGALTDSSQEPINLIRYDNTSDWKSVVSGWTRLLAIKNDGSLWRIGTNRFSGKAPWPGLRSFEPFRLGTDSDWEEIFRAAHSLAYRKTDGRVFIQESPSSKQDEVLKLDEDLSLVRVPYLEDHRWRGVVWASQPRVSSFQAGVTENGVFQVIADYQLRDRKYALAEREIQIGRETNWLAVAGWDTTVVTLRSDGTLWQWEFGNNPLNPGEGAKATRLGTHSDWVGITADSSGIVSLAADGTLWYWRFDPLWSFDFQPLLRSTRKPQLIGNVFAGTE